MIPIHSLYWPNVNKAIVEGHRACAQKHGLEITYTAEQVNHGEWLDSIARTELEHHEAIAFMDIDCLAYSAEAVQSALSYALGARSFIGLAQSAYQRSDYAAPAFLIITREAYQILGKPSLKRDRKRRLDAAQRLSVAADERWFAYRLLYPIGYHFPSPKDGPWRLGGYGHYGIGTEYAGGFFHLFESRLDASTELFAKKVEQILAGTPQPTTAPYMSAGFSLAHLPSRIMNKPRGIARYLGWRY